MKTFLIAGARPNFMKIAPIYREARKHGQVECKIVHTGQHYDYEMSQAFFEDLEISKPHFFLDAGSGTHAVQTAKIMVAFEELCQEEKPDLVIVVGDVNSTLACSVVASRMGIPIGHVEAGLRSFDRGMPEEINRIVTDVLSDFLFVSEESGLVNLKNEGVADEKVHFVGNIMIDSLVHFLPAIERSRIQDKLGLESGTYTLLTFHRPSNVDNEDALLKLVAQGPNARAFHFHGIMCQLTRLAERDD